MKTDIRTMILHRQAEKIIEESGIGYIFLSPNEFMQNFINFHSPSIKSNNAFYLPAGHSMVSIFGVCDFVVVAVKARGQNRLAKYHNKTTMLTRPGSRSCDRMVEYFLK